ncbi:MAG: UvrD-helicase domain-containing protein [Planctomycetia bacterium]|nr:UvrD-helicase domain-containing protein [Planctomycetia bacterium]
MGTASPVSLTPQQERAVEMRRVSVALSAGAGCGKTHVLVERYLSHLTPGARLAGPDATAATALAGLIAITFTDRAAREMRDRVRRRCRQRLQRATDETLADGWLALLRELETARVSTIHAFAGALVRSHAVEAGIDPHFQILQPGQSATLFAEVMDDCLRDDLGRRREEVIDLVVAFGLRRLRDMVQCLVPARHTIDYAAWRTVTPEALVARWQETERARLAPLIRGEFAALSVARTVLDIARSAPSSHEVMQERFGELVTLLPAAHQWPDWRDALERIREAARVQGAAARQWDSEDLYEQFKQAAEALRGWVAETLKSTGIGASALGSAAAGLALLRVAEPILTRYEARKRELAALDFDDLLILARDLLRGPNGEDARRQLSSRLELLLVDEFQDTDPLQVELVKILCGEQLAGGKLFFVGDAKQSIYRFRGADPRVFRQLREAIPSEGQLPLNRNFRSQPAILDFVNALFCERLGPNYEPLLADRKALGEGPTVEFLWARPADDAEEKLTADRFRHIEADWIARRLATLFDERQTLVPDATTREPRPAEPGDVAILFRSLSDVQHYEAALRRHGIEYYLVGGHAFYAQQEVFDLLNLLRFLDCADDQISLAGVLRSPYFSLADSTLFWLARHDRGLAAGLFAETLPPELDEPERRKAAFAARTLAHLRARKDRLPIAGLISEALALTGYDAILLAEFLGERKLANLRKLIDQARSFDQSGIFTLADFVAQLAEFVARQPDEPPAPIQPESSDVVRLMTIHQAKGLEFPVVVVPDLGRSLGGSYASAVYHVELGPLVTAPGDNGRDRPNGMDLYRILERQEDADEEMRLLYVATTRAADYLILSAGVKNLDDPSGDWLALLASRFALRTGRLTAELPEGFAPPRVRVTLEEPPAPARRGQGSGRVDIARLEAAAREDGAAGRGFVPATVHAIPADKASRTVYSFSRLAGAFDDTEPAEVEYLPSSRLEAAAEDAATELGILVHAILAQVDFAGSNDVRSLCERHLDRRFGATTLDVGAAVDMVERFLRSPRAAELRAAETLHRELEFLLAWPPGGPRDGRMIQGTIDCLHQDATGQWHVLDFKTNRITAASVPQAAKAYELQMMLYALATEEALRASPASLVLHFLQPGAEQAIAWNAASRAGAIKAVNAALAKENDECLKSNV